MQYPVVWTLILFAIVVSVLPGFLESDNTTIDSIMGGETNTIDSGLLQDANPFFSSFQPSLPSLPRVYRNSLPNGVFRQWIDLSWDNRINPRTVVIYTPDTSLGPFQNIDDGIIDQRIYLEISSPGNLTPGTWYYTVQADGSSPDENALFRIYRESEGIHQ